MKIVLAAVGGNVVLALFVFFLFGFFVLLKKLFKPREYFYQLTDGKAVKCLRRKYGWEEARRIVGEWRQLAQSLGYTGPVAWRVRGGFTFKKHAPKLGQYYFKPKRKRGQYADEEIDDTKDWDWKDEPTRKAVVFWVPRLVKDSVRKEAAEQLALLGDLRRERKLPPNHLSFYGNAALLSGLMLTHYKLTGERVPLDEFRIRTDTNHGKSGGLGLVFSEEEGLDCVMWVWHYRKSDDLGCFPLGEERL